MVEQKTPKKVFVFVANGSEEIESVCVIDILRRAEFHVTVVKVPDSPEDSKDLLCKMSRFVNLVINIMNQNYIGG